MENFMNEQEAIQALCLKYPALYECDCPALGRTMGDYRTHALDTVFTDIRRMYQMHRSLVWGKRRPFVLLFSAVGGCLWEGLLLNRLAACGIKDIQVIIIEPMYKKYPSVTAAVDAFSQLIMDLFHVSVTIYDSLSRYFRALTKGDTLRADIYIAVDSDRREDTLLLLDSVEARKKFNQQLLFDQKFPLLYVASLASHLDGQTLVRHLQRSLLVVQASHYFGFQVLQFGSQILSSREAFCWIGERLFFPNYFSLDEQLALEEGGVAVVLVQCFLQQQDLSILFAHFGQRLFSDRKPSQGQSV